MGASEIEYNFEAESLLRYIKNNSFNLNSFLSISLNELSSALADIFNIAFGLYKYDSCVIYVNYKIGDFCF